ncbi:hypothetical protein R1sor_018239 [Riccia sorocarpa]|uniref:Uncharacterized protein n=1 Tax=Riccia sorocarpa TaxID=122646 RepID=A0ABD3I995_9MARC
MEGRSMQGPQRVATATASDSPATPNRGLAGDGRRQIRISNRGGLRGIRRLVERGILTYYYRGEQMIGAFRSWVTTNWGRKFNVQIDSIQEAGDRAMLTVLETTEERDEILRNLHPPPPIRGCLIAHFPWTPEMDKENFQPQLKPMQVEICNIPKWAKDELPRVFMILGQVLHIPQESREMVRKDVRGTILWKEEEDLPDTILVTILNKTTTCKVLPNGGEMPRETNTMVGNGERKGANRTNRTASRRALKGVPQRTQKQKANQVNLLAGIQENDLQPGGEIERGGTNARSLKRRCYSPPRRDAYSEPTLDLQLGMQGGLRASRSE